MNFQDASNLRIPEGYVRTIHDKNSRLLWGSVGYDVSFDGNATQTTYSGKNLCESATVQNGNNIRFYFGTTNSLKMVLSAIINSQTSSYTIYLFASGTDYGSVGTMTGNANARSVAYITLTQTQLDAIQLGGTNYFLLYRNGGNFSTVTDAQIENGETLTAYEPYVGGTPAPNPEFPQEIKTVTGEQTVKVTGKNLFNITPRKTGDGYYNNNAGSYVDNSYDDSLVTYETTENGVTATILTAWKGLFFASTPLKAGTQYHFKWNATSTGNVRASVYTLDSSFKIVRRIGNYTANPTSSDANITLQDGEVCIGLWVGSNNANDVLTISQPQIELGGQATSYEVFTGQEFPINLGTIELAKVGAYTDGITRVGTKWYIEKQVGKMVLDGSEDGWTFQPSNAPFRYRLTGSYATYDDASTFISDYFQSVAWNASWVNYDYLMSPNSENNILVFRYTGISTLEDFKAWLSTHPTTVYYALATPTTTEITDATLIAQLEAVYDWVRRHGYNASVTGDLPIIINRTALPTA